MRIQTIIIFILALVLASCGPAPTFVPTEKPISSPTSAFTPILQPPTTQPPTPQMPKPQQPTLQPPYPKPFSPTPTLGVKLEKWMEYENALAAVFLPLPFLTGKVLCEWVILGHPEGKVYVWAMCQEDYANGEGMSAPAVIYLTKNDHIDWVEIPGESPQFNVDVHRMFPQELWEKISSVDIPVNEMSSHILLRLKNPGPPLIAESGISLP